jgi:N-acetylmuramoyl-L-alanine amidase
MMAYRLIERPSPNHDARGTAIDMLVLHYTGMKTAEEALARLCDPQAKVSAHYTIDRDGRVYAHVPEERRAWHAGLSFWAGERNINGCSVGIELVNPGHEFGYEPFPETQIAALIDLAGEIMGRHAIPPGRVLGHSDVAPARKEDPGELFPWPQLADFGIGIWPFAQSVRPSVTHFVRATSPASGGGKVAEHASVFPPPHAGEVRVTATAGTGAGGIAEPDIDVEHTFLRNLRAYGYGAAPDVDVPQEKVVAAFQRHWRPWQVDGIIDEESAYRLGTLIDALS